MAAPSSEPGKIFGDRSTLVVLFGFGSVALPWTLRLDLRVRSRLSFFVVATGIFRVVHKILGFSSHPAFSPWVSAAFFPGLFRREVLSSYPFCPFGGGGGQHPPSRAQDHRRHFEKLLYKLEPGLNCVFSPFSRHRRLRSPSTSATRSSTSQRLYSAFFLPLYFAAALCFSVLFLTALLRSSFVLFGFLPFSTSAPQF